MVTIRSESLRGAKTVNGRTVPLYYRKYQGKSTDHPKPTEDVFNGSVFHEIDTSKVFWFDGETCTWAERGTAVN